MKQYMKLNVRIFWYSIILYIAAFITSGFILLPWFYVVLPLVVLLVTVYYFEKDEEIVKILERKLTRKKDKVFALGLWVSTFWFLVVLCMGFVQIAGFYYFDFGFFFGDPRNYLIFPLVLLVPAIYSIQLEKSIFGKKKQSKKRHFTLGSLKLSS